MQRRAGPCWSDVWACWGPTTALRTFVAVGQNMHVELPSLAGAFLQHVRLGQWPLARATVRVLHGQAPDVARALLRTFALNPSASQWFAAACPRDGLE